MSQKSLNIEQLRDLIHKGEASDPLVFLESVMNGQDPRNLSGIYKLLTEIDNFTNGDIEKSDWNEIMDYVFDHARFKPVSISESHSAAKTLAEYLHSKRKQVEVTTTSSDSNPSNDPLTEEEIELFKEKFNDEF